MIPTGDTQNTFGEPLTPPLFVVLSNLEWEEYILQQRTNTTMEATTAAEYLEKHNIYGMFEDLMQQLIIHKPEDPLEFLITQLNKPAVLKVIVAGPPASGKGTQCEMIVNKYGLVHVSTGDLLREEVRKGSPLGEKAKNFMSNGQLVPDDLINDIVFNKLSSTECQTKGWLLDGYPRTKAQALSLQSHGIYPDKCILLSVPDEVVIERVDGRRIDPVTDHVYHVKFNPPPQEEAILARLIHRDDDTEAKMVTRLASYHTHLDGIKSCFAPVLGVVNANQHKDKVFDGIVEFIDKTVSSSGKAPKRPPRLFIVGPPGSGRRTQNLTNCIVWSREGDPTPAVEGPARRPIGLFQLAKLISVKHDLVLVSVPDLLRGAAIPGQPSDEAIAALLKHRINQKDCLTQGWVLAGFPTSLKQAEVFQKAGVTPTKVIHLGIPDEEAKERVLNRKVDPKTGTFYDMKTKPPREADIVSRLITHTDDTDQAFAAHLTEYLLWWYFWAAGVSTRLNLFFYHSRYHDSINGIKNFYSKEIKSVDAHADLKAVGELVVSTLF